MRLTARNQIIRRLLCLGAALVCASARVAYAQDYPPGPNGPPLSASAEQPGWERFSLIYSPELLLSNSSLGPALHQAAQGDGIHNIGIESSMQTGWFARYHAQLDYTYGDGFSGVRLEPLGFGWAFPLVRSRSVSFEIEPLVSLADMTLLFTHDNENNSNVTFLLGSSVEVQANLLLGPIYIFASPLGLELRYLKATSGEGGATTTGADPYYRFRVGIGVQY